MGDGFGVLLAEVGFERQRPNGAYAAHCFDEHIGCRRACYIASVFPASGDCFESTCDNVNIWARSKTDKSKFPRYGQTPNDCHECHYHCNIHGACETAQKIPHLLGIALEASC